MLDEIVLIAVFSSLISVVACLKGRVRNQKIWFGTGHGAVLLGFLLTCYVGDGLHQYVGIIFLIIGSMLIAGNYIFNTAYRRRRMD